jgi:hypothetical protein
MKFFFNKRQNGEAVAEELVMVNETLDLPRAEVKDEQVAAAIALSLYLYTKHLREYEKAVITFQKIMKPYSPWSSKIYGLRQQPMYMPNLKSKR